MVRDVSQIDRESFKLLVDSVKDYAIFMLDLTGHVSTWNKGAEQIKGYTAREILGSHISVFYTPEAIERNEPEKNLQKTKDLGRYEVEGWRMRKDGSVFWANVVFTSLKDAYGELIGFAKVTRDMSARKEADDQNKDINKRLRDQLVKSRSETIAYIHALDESSIVAITNQKGIITHVNENFCKISKYDKQELLGQDHRIINSGYHPKEFIRDLWVSIAHGTIWRGELKNKAKDGSYYWVDTTIVPFLNDQGKPYQYLAIRSDITQRKLAEEEIIQINKDLEGKVNLRTQELTAALEREKELSELKSRFVSLASHEFRTPLSAILSSASLIGHYKEWDQDDKRQKHINRIKSSVEHLTDILDEFLSLERLEQGKVEVLRTPFKLVEFMEDMINEMEGMLAKKDQKIQASYQGQTDVYLDKKILRHILLNLLSNASKYSAQEKTIHISTTVSKTIVTISVKDEGVGIPEDAQRDIFSKFFRASNVGHIQGTGLGLNIVKKYVELLGGTIDFSSRENEGSVFTVKFPLA
jgi:PAS domain S-box-containing protein